MLVLTHLLSDRTSPKPFFPPLLLFFLSIVFCAFRSYIHLEFKVEQELKQTNQIHFLSILLFAGSNTSVFHISSLRYILDTMKSGLASSELILADVQPFNNFES